MKPHFTALIEKEDNMYVALCPEIDIASQGNSIEEAKDNLREAVELFFEFASESEIQNRLHYDIYISPLEVNLGKNTIAIG
jgi:predicted RNase H-like HicB family nuclease